MGGLGGRGGSAGEAGRLLASDYGTDEALRLSQSAVWALRAGMRALAGELRSGERAGDPQISGVHRRGGGPCDCARWIAFRGAWRWAGAGGAAAKDVWAGVDGGFPGI